MHSSYMMTKPLSHVKEMADFLDDDTIDWQNGLAHLNDPHFDSIYSQQHHLLGLKNVNHFRHPVSGRQNEPQVEDPDESKLSDAVTFGPRFCLLFREYTQQLDRPVDTDRHLMSLCTEHLVPFCKWARENEAKASNIRATLLEYDYLRPEVRNGIVMVIIYTFASIKALSGVNADMFTTLQDAERGLGIANKFSLKIYNDPFMYLSFLKISISALIDAGAIPDNERVNQPKRNKVMVENKEELDAYDQIQKRLVSLLDAGDNAGAKHIVLLMTNYWQQRAKFIRNRRFVSVLHALGDPKPVIASQPVQFQSSSSSSVSQTPHFNGNGNGNGNGASSSNFNSGEINRNPQCNAHGTNQACCGTCGLDTASVSADDDKSAPAKRARVASQIGESNGDAPIPDSKPHSPSETTPGLSTSHYHFPTGRRCSPRPIDALRFERVGSHEWSIIETKVYDVCEFMKMLALDMGDTPVCLIDESALQQCSGFLPRKIAGSIGLGGIGYKSTVEGVMSLTKELTLNNSLITSWTKADRPQLREMACQWQWQKQLPAADSEGGSEGGGSKDETLMTFWRSSDTTDFSLGGRNSCLCYDCSDVDDSHPCGGKASGCGGCGGAEGDQARISYGHEESKTQNGYPHPHVPQPPLHQQQKQQQLLLPSQTQIQDQNQIPNINLRNINQNPNHVMNNHNLNHHQNQNQNQNQNQHYNNIQNPVQNQGPGSSEYPEGAYRNTVGLPQPSPSFNNNNNGNENMFHPSNGQPLRQQQQQQQQQPIISSYSPHTHTHGNPYGHPSYHTRSSSQPKGYLVYEQTLQVGVVIRSNPFIGIHEDLWCVLFPTELNATYTSEPFGALLSRLFPQLSIIFGKKPSNDYINGGGGGGVGDSRNKADDVIAVKYFAHRKGLTLSSPPTAPETFQAYRTIGTVSLAASTILAKISEGSIFHDFVFSPVL